MNRRIRLKKKLTGYSFSKRDLWCLDRTLARFCAEGIRQFIKMKRNSYPGNLTPESWEKVLKDIHWSLDNIANDYIDDPWEQRIRKGIEPRYNRALETEYDERIRRGLKLFGQYFCDLWN